MNVRDIISSIIFYLGLVVISAALIQVGTTYGWEKVDEKFNLMEPRLRRSDHVWINKRIRQPDELSYGDIIMYRRPLWKRGSIKYEFARVIGRPGDLVEVQGRSLFRAERQKGELQEKQQVTEHYIQAGRSHMQFKEFMVPCNSVFVLYDDRSQEVPLRDIIVPTRSIIGRVIY